MQKIKIIKSSDSLYWYTKHIGEVFDLERETVDYYWARERGGFRCLNIVAKQDAEVIEITETN